MQWSNDWIYRSFIALQFVSNLCHRVWSGSLACIFKVSPFLFIRRVTSSEKSNSNAYYNMFYKNNTQKETKSNNNLLYTYMMGDQQLLHTTIFQIDLFKSNKHNWYFGSLLAFVEDTVFIATTLIIRIHQLLIFIRYKNNT